MSTPSPWHQATDPKSGKVYYYNKVTKQTQWTKPADLDGPTADAAATPAPAATPASPTPAPSTTTTTTTTTTTATAPTPATTTTTPAAATSPTPANADAATAPEDVPANWNQASDPKSGKVYYYNKVTKKTQWSKPACLQESAPAPAAGPAAAAAAAPVFNLPDPAKEKEKEKEKEPEKAAPVADKPVDKPSEPTPTPPAASTPAPAASASATPSSDASAPAKPEWSEARDPATGRTYWYNRITKQTTWKNPADTAAAAAAAAAIAAEKDKASSSSSSAAAASPAPAPAPAPTPASPSSSSSPAPSPASSSTVASSSSSSSSSSGTTRPASQSTSGTQFQAMINVVGGNDSISGVERNERKAALLSMLDEEEPQEETAATTTSGEAKDITHYLREEDSDDDEKAKGKDDKERKKLQEEEGEEASSWRFAKHRKGLFNRLFRTGQIFDETKLMSFKKSQIKKALLKQNRELDDEAVQTFKNIMSYMGDRKSSKPPIEHAKKMLRNLMIAPAGLRDEAYMQICKQTTSNPNAESTIRGWELMTFFLATFPPSKNLKSFLIQHMEKSRDAASTAPRIQALTTLCLSRLETILTLGQRKQVPSQVELHCLQECKNIPIKVELCNGTWKTILVSPYDLVSDITSRMHAEYHVVYSLPFALYEAAEANEERILDPDDRVLDVVANWENKPLLEEIKIDKSNEKQKKYDKIQAKEIKLNVKVIKYCKLLYKAKLVLKTNNLDFIADSEAVNLIYIQATQDVVTERYPCSEKDICVLGALQMQASFGDYRKDVHVPGWMKPRIQEFMPIRYLEKKAGTGKMSDTLIAEWEQKILAKYMKVSGFTSLEAKLNYLDYVQEWIYYGCTFFNVEQRQFKDYPATLTMGINNEGVLLLHPEKKTVLENYPYTDVVTWGHSDEKFIIVVGNIVQQRKLIFKSADGAHINHLIHDYVKLKVKNKEATPGLA